MTSDQSSSTDASRAPAGFSPARADSPIRPTDDEARDLACRLMTDARFGALGVIDPASGMPHVTRIAVGYDGRAPLILVSTLALHTRALLADPVCSLLMGEPGPKGDPLTHPRLTLQARAEPAEKAGLRDSWLAVHPKTKLYYDFPDFRMFRLVVREGYLNGGFGRAFVLSPSDLAARTVAGGQDSSDAVGNPA